MKRISILSVIVLAVVSGIAWQQTAYPKQAGETVNWISIEEAEARAAKDGKKILVDVYTDWCGWCKVMDKQTYTDPEVVNLINDHFHAVKLDAEQRENIQVKGYTFKFVDQGRRGYHEFAAALLNGQMQYPSTVFLESNLNPLYIVPGYIKAKMMGQILAYTQEEAYKENIPFEEFQKSR